MSSVVTIDSPDLRRLLAEGLRLDRGTQDEMAKKLAEAGIRWKIKLKGPSISAPGLGLWPVGNILGLGTSGERYLDSDDPRGRDSGRSLGAWDVDQAGINLKATNTAVDARRNSYAEYVHFSGAPTGQAVDDAFDAFEAEVLQAVEEMADIVARALAGP